MSARTTPGLGNAGVSGMDHLKWDNLQGIEDVRLGQVYDGVTLRDAQSEDSTAFSHMRGSFQMEEQPAWVPGSAATLCRCPVPTFRRTFPSGQVVTYGLHTPSRRLDIVIGDKTFQPGLLAE